MTPSAHAAMLSMAACINNVMNKGIASQPFLFFIWKSRATWLNLEELRFKVIKYFLFLSIARTTKWSLRVEIFADFQVNFYFYFGSPLKRMDAQALIFNSVASDFVSFFPSSYSSASWKKEEEKADGEKKSTK